MTKKEIILRKKENFLQKESYLEKRKYKRFHTTIDENILKQIRISAIELDMSVNQIIELMYNFMANIDDDVMLEMLKESLDKNCNCGEIISTIWKDHKQMMGEERC
ncbi:MAG: hypothetical protein ACRDB9_07600 [Cetobacterium sp.]